jgi:hypothetical protein
MDGLCGDRSASAPWVISEIPFQDVDCDQVHDDRQLFIVLPRPPSSRSQPTCIPPIL